MVGLADSERPKLVKPRSDHTDEYLEDKHVDDLAVSKQLKLRKLGA